MPESSAAAAIMRSSGARCCPRSASIPKTASARSSIDGVRYSTSMNTATEDCEPCAKIGNRPGRVADFEQGGRRDPHEAALNAFSPLVGVNGASESNECGLVDRPAARARSPSRVRGHDHARAITSRSAKSRKRAASCWRSPVVTRPRARSASWTSRRRTYSLRERPSAEHVGHRSPR